MEKHFKIFFKYPKLFHSVNLNKCLVCLSGLLISTRIRFLYNKNFSFIFSYFV